MDVLTDVLNSLDLRGSLYCRSELAAPWGLHFVRHPTPVFHVVDRGNCWLQLADEATARPLVAGDLVMLPHGSAHTVTDAPNAATYPPVRMDYDAYRECQHWLPEHAGPTTVLLCGTFHFANGVEHPLLTQLPRVIHLRLGDDDQAPGLAATLRFMGSEAALPRPGTEALMRRLADILFIQVLRAWMAGEGRAGALRGWLGALRDPAIGRALGLIHRNPERDWSVADLAAAVALSRSAFAARFTGLVGAAPVRYLRGWRLQCAARLLQQPGTGVAEVARRSGYESAAAFSKAFKRELGVSPGHFRRGAAEGAVAGPGGGSAATAPPR